MYPQQINSLFSYLKALFSHKEKHPVYLNYLYNEPEDHVTRTRDRLLVTFVSQGRTRDEPQN